MGKKVGLSSGTGEKTVGKDGDYVELQYFKIRHLPTSIPSSSLLWLALAKKKAGQNFLGYPCYLLSTSLLHLSLPLTRKLWPDVAQSLLQPDGEFYLARLLLSLPVHHSSILQPHVSRLRLLRSKNCIGTPLMVALRLTHRQVAKRVLGYRMAERKNLVPSTIRCMCIPKFFKQVQSFGDESLLGVGLVPAHARNTAIFA